MEHVAGLLIERSASQPVQAYGCQIVGTAIFRRNPLEVHDQVTKGVGGQSGHRRLQPQRVGHPLHTGDAQQESELGLVSALEHGRLRLEPEKPRCPAQMRLQDLTHVHSARHAKRVEHDVDRRAVRQERHVLFRHDTRDDALVTVAAGHLVTHGDLPLLRQINLHQLNHTRRQLIGLEDLVDLILGLLLETRSLRLGGLDSGPHALVRGFRRQPQRLQVDSHKVEVGEFGFRDLGARRQVLLHRAVLEHQGDFLVRENVA